MSNYAPFVIVRPDGFVGVEVTINDQLTPAEARELAVDLVRLAGEAEAELGEGAPEVPSEIDELRGALRAARALSFAHGKRCRYSPVVFPHCNCSVQVLRTIVDNAIGPLGGTK